MPRGSSGAGARPAAVRADVAVEAGDWPPRPRLAALARRALAAAAAAVRPPLPASAEVSLLFTDDAHVRILNRRYRRRNKPTNVLSFPAPRAPGGALPPLLGDIAFAAETVATEAASGGLALSDHLAHLIVHGFLHLIGYDHADEAEAEAMEALETRILNELGVADPYAPVAPARRPR